MKPSIIVFEGHDVSVFRSAARAERKIEHYDVESNAFTAVFDAEGRQLELRVVPDDSWLGRLGEMGANRVTVRPSQPERIDPERLMSLLKQALGTSGQTSLDELVAQALDRFEVD